MELPITPEKVRIFAPEFKDLSDEEIQMYIDLADSFLCTKKWGAKAAQGLMLMTCHLMKTMGLGATGGGSSGAVGPVTSERVGDLSRSYATANVGSGATDNLLAMTRYGQLLVLLRKTMVFTPMVT